jgi:hypothetical protein
MFLMSSLVGKIKLWSGKCLLVSALGFFLVMNAVLAQYPLSEENDFSDIFGQDYAFAVNLIREEPWMSDTLSAHGLDPAFALAIVFPELIRYSSIMDYAQLTGLEVLYVQYGHGYADFSVGWFQMKPSFAERIEVDIFNHYLEDCFLDLKKLDPDTLPSAEVRRERLLRLKDPYFQLLYLEAFIRIMDEKYPGNSFNIESEKLAFYATAYNTGYFKEETLIRDEMKKKRFYKGLNSSSERFSYSDISLKYLLSAPIR